jgi:hypothetical protein
MKLAVINFRSVRSTTDAKQHRIANPASGVSNPGDLWVRRWESGEFGGGHPIWAIKRIIFLQPDVKN